MRNMAELCNRYNSADRYSGGCNKQCCVSLLERERDRERGCCDFAAKLALSTLQQITTLSLSLPGPNRVLYSLSHCVQTAVLQVIQRSYTDALTADTWCDNSTLQHCVSSAGVTHALKFTFPFIML